MLDGPRAEERGSFRLCHVRSHTRILAMLFGSAKAIMPPMPAAILGPIDLAAAIVFAFLLFGIMLGLAGVARQIDRLRASMVETFTDDERLDHA